jgi:hypothetical protein
MMDWWNENFHNIPQSAFTLADTIFNLTDDDSEIPESYYTWVYNYATGNYNQLTQEQL